MESLTMVQFLVALCMSIAAFCLLLWALLADMFSGIEDPKYRMYYREMGNDKSDQTES